MKTLQEILDCPGYDLEVQAYSGRGMMGTKCLGVVFDDFGDVLAAVAEAGDDARHWRAELRSVRIDSMGKRSIAYFPDVDYDASGDTPECTYCYKRAVRQVNGEPVCGDTDCG